MFLSQAGKGLIRHPSGYRKWMISWPLKKGQSLGHIYATHAEKLGCSRRTAYTYIASGVFDVRNLDLRRKVKYKKRKTSTTCSTNNRTFRINRSYKDFQKLLEKITGDIPNRRKTNRYILLRSVTLQPKGSLRKESRVYSICQAEGNIIWGFGWWESYSAYESYQ